MTFAKIISAIPKHKFIIGGLSLTAMLIAMPTTTRSQEVAALNPTSGWDLNMPGGENAYCALSRSFDQDIVLSLGRNQAEEYSLAIDFQTAKLDPEKAYSITLQPGPGQIRAYEMLPASARAMVVRLGYDDTFFKALEKSGALKAEINKVQYNFKMSDMVAAQDQLSTCMAKLKGESPQQMAKFEAEKIVDPAEKIEAKPVVEEAAEKVEEVKEEVQAEAVKATAEPKELIASAAPQPEEQKPEIKIERVGQQQKPIEEIKPEEAKTAAVEEAAEPIKEAKVEETQPKGQPKVEEQAKPEEKPVEVAFEKEEEKTLATKIVPQPTPGRLKRPDSVQREQRVASSVSRVSAKPMVEKKPAPEMAKEEATPKPMSAPEVKADKVSTPIPKEEKVVEEKVVKAEPKKEKPVEEKVAKVEPEPEPKEEQKAPVPPKSENLDAIREEVAILRIENQKLYEDARKARAQIDSVAVESGNQALRRIREYEKKLEAQKADNVALSREIEELRTMQEDGRMDVVRGDWDLEKATKRYNEAEREIKRLGLLLEQQKSAHRREKSELEQMLFDPAVTEREQRNKLAALERQVEESNLKLERAQKEMAEQAKAPPKEIIKPDPKVLQEKQRLAAEKAKLEQELQQAKAALAQKPKTVAPDPMVEEENKKLAVKTQLLEQQLLAAQAQLKQAQAKPAVSVDPKIEEQNKQLAIEKERLAQELQRAQSQLKQAKIAMTNQPRVPVSKPDPKVQQNNIQIEQLNKKIEMQNEQLQVYQRKIAEENQQKQSLLQQQAALKQQAEQAAQQAAQAAAQAQAVQQSMLEAQKQAAEQAARIAAEQAAKAAAAQAAQLAEKQAAQLAAQQAAQQQAAELAAQKQAAEQAAIDRARQLAAQRAAQERAQEEARRQAAIEAEKARQQKVTYSKNDLETLLNRSGLTLRNGVAQKSETLYRWNTGTINGTASIAPAKNGSNIARFVDSYINGAERACNGEFASLPASSGPNSYEIACIGPTRSSSSSVIFVEQKGHYLAIAHETTAEDMDLAMDARDRVADSL
ncbi:MAG: hypothetical protein AAGB32_02460 [Pseudomonadota bacterium]